MKLAKGANRWLILQKPQEHPRLRMFCFPHAGAGASMFHSWASRFRPGTEAAAIQLPGREGRIAESPFTHAGPAVAAIVDQLRPHLDLPYAFFGHSMGALLAFEVARALVERGCHPPVLLGLSGRQAPGVTCERAVSHLSDDDFLARVVRMNGIPAAALEHPELLSLLLPVLRADFALCESYAPAGSQPLRVPISVFGGRADPIGETALRGWQKHTTFPLRTRMYDGDHFFFRSHHARVIDALNSDLADFCEEPSVASIRG